MMRRVVFFAFVCSVSFAIFVSQQKAQKQNRAGTVTKCYKIEFVSSVRRVEDITAVLWIEENQDPNSESVRVALVGESGDFQGFVNSLRLELCDAAGTWSTVVDYGKTRFSQEILTSAVKNDEIRSIRQCFENIGYPSEIAMPRNLRLNGVGFLTK